MRTKSWKQKTKNFETFLKSLNRSNLFSRIYKIMLLIQFRLFILIPNHKLLDSKMSAIVHALWLFRTSIFSMKRILRRSLEIPEFNSRLEIKSAEDLMETSLNVSLLTQRAMLSKCSMISEKKMLWISWWSMIFLKKSHFTKTSFLCIISISSSALTQELFQCFSTNWLKVVSIMRLAWEKVREIGTHLLNARR